MKKRTLQDFADKTRNTIARFDEPRADRSIWITQDARGSFYVGHAYKLRSGGSGSTRYRSAGPFTDIAEAEKAFLRLVAKYEVKQ